MTIGTVAAVVIALTGLFTTDPAQREYARTITVAVLEAVEAGVGSVTELAFEAGATSTDAGHLLDQVGCGQPVLVQPP